MVKKRALQDGKAEFSFGFWEAFFECFLGVPNFTVCENCGEEKKGVYDGL